ncbi:hypothetical protein [Dankookia sp. P2]|uniref:hypothetical protein n=1 Tax=Dankookia sp. P2 TaxID=3423955 RepID=UPI003D66C55E
MTAPRPARRTRPPRGFATALGMSFALMLLVAGGIADRGGAFPLVVLGGAAAAMGLLYLVFPHGPASPWARQMAWRCMPASMPCSAAPASPRRRVGHGRPASSCR